MEMNEMELNVFKQGKGTEKKRKEKECNEIK